MPLVQPEKSTKEEYKEDPGKKKMWETSMKQSRGARNVPTYWKALPEQVMRLSGVSAALWCNQNLPLDIILTPSAPLLVTAYMAPSKGDAKHHPSSQRNQKHFNMLEWPLEQLLHMQNDWETSNQTLQQQYLKDFQCLTQVLEYNGAALIGTKGPYQDSVQAQVMRTHPDCLPLTA